MKGYEDMDKKIKIFAILLVILAVILIPSSYALHKHKYDGGASLALAEWNVSLEQNGVNNTLSVVPGISNATYTLNVKSLSNVDVKYDVIVSNLPTGVEASLDGTNFTPASNGTITFTNVGIIPYNAGNNGVDTKTITLRAVNNATTVNNQTVTVNVIAKQIVGS